jgi:uncharacterized protein with HEPN domain
METEVLKHLRDIQDAASAIRRFVRGKSLQDYSQDELLRSGVERKFEIIGEALNRIKQCAPNILDRIAEHRSVISFRNILIHGYDTIDDRVVWGVIQEDLDNLLEDVMSLMCETP